MAVGVCESDGEMTGGEAVTRDRWRSRRRGTNALEIRHTERGDDEILNICVRRGTAASV